MGLGFRVWGLGLKRASAVGLCFCSFAAWGFRVSRISRVSRVFGFLGFFGDFWVSS